MISAALELVQLAVTVAQALAQESINSLLSNNSFRYCVR
jgi:hypothetical protein